MVDDSHATGFIGRGGRGSHELRGVIDRIDILTGTLGKAWAAPAAAIVAARKEIVAWLRQRSRPYLFSNSIAPTVAAATHPGARSAGGFRGACAIGCTRMPATFGSACRRSASTWSPASTPSSRSCSAMRRWRCELAERMQAEGVYVVAFSFPVVPHGKARIRTQMNAAHTHAATRSGDSAFGRAGARSRHHSLEAVHESTGQGARGTRHLDAGRPGTLGRPQRCAHQGASLGDLRHRHAHLQLGCVGAEDGAGADGGRPRVFRRNRRNRQRGARLQHRRPGVRRGPHHLRPLPQLPRRTPASVPQYLRRGRQSRGRLRRVPDDSGNQCVQAAAGHRR